MIQPGRDVDDVYRAMAAEEIPWNIARPPESLVALVERGTVSPCRAIDVGCGAGNYAIYLAGKGFEMTGVDISPAAIALAQRNAEERGADCRFLVADLTAGAPVGLAPFDFGYDWEVLHHVFPEERPAFARSVHAMLRPGARYLSVCFSERSAQFGGEGKVRRTSIGTVLYFSSEEEIAALYDPLFQIDELRTVDAAGRRGTHQVVYALMRCREYEKESLA